MNKQGIWTRSQTQAVSDNQGNARGDSVQHGEAGDQVEGTDGNLVVPPPDRGSQAWTQVLVVNPQILSTFAPFQWSAR